jgi:hypothetical protein
LRCAWNEREPPVRAVSAARDGKACWGPPAGGVEETFAMSPHRPEPMEVADNLSGAHPNGTRSSWAHPCAPRTTSARFLEGRGSGPLEPFPRDRRGTRV